MSYQGKVGYSFFPELLVPYNGFDKLIAYSRYDVPSNIF
jgi:hypothetical protein